MEGVGVEQFKDGSNKKGESGAKWEAKVARKVVRTSLEVLDLSDGDEVEKLDKELAGEIGLVTGESFDSNEDGRGGDDKDV